MNPAKRKRLEATGWRIGDYGDFLELTDEERRMVELRLSLSRKIRETRLARGLTQTEMAKIVGTSQPRFAAIEAALPGVSLDLLTRVWMQLGGDLMPTTVKATARPKKSVTPKATSTKRTRVRKKAGTPAKV